MADVTISGMEAIISNLKYLDGIAQAEVAQLLEKAAKSCAADAANAAPVDTGNLQHSVNMVNAPTEAYVWFDADYALYVEMGHRTRSGSFVPAQPFLYPAFEAAAQQLEDDLKGL